MNGEAMTKADGRGCLGRRGVPGSCGVWLTTQRGSLEGRGRQEDHSRGSEGEPKQEQEEARELGLAD
jgi:hypothetical protein